MSIDYAAIALRLGWEITPVSMYDEEDVDGWQWDAPDGQEYFEIGIHEEPPECPDDIKENLLNAELARLRAIEAAARKVVEANSNDAPGVWVAISNLQATLEAKP